MCYMTIVRLCQSCKRPRSIVVANARSLGVLSILRLKLVELKNILLVQNAGLRIVFRALIAISVRLVV